MAAVFRGRLRFTVAGICDNPHGIGHLRALVVEDEMLIRWSVVETLNKAGCIVTEAPDGVTALRVLSEAPDAIDVVVLDYRLPDSNDLSLLARIRQVSPRSAVLMMTAFGTADVIQQALALGVSRVIEKPFELHDLESWIVQACTPAPQ
jgi:two-component system response regulator AtoC